MAGLWTTARLRESCLKLLRSGDYQLKVSPLLDCRAVVDKSRKELTIDPHQSSAIEAVVHELLHVLLDSTVGGHFNHSERSPNLWETIIDAMEKRIADNIMADPRKTEIWRAAIEQRLKG